MKPVPIGERLFEKWHLDVAGPLRKSNNGNMFILLCVESVSKFPIAFALESQESSVIAEALYNGIFCIFGLPRRISTDRGTNFLGKILGSLYDLLGIKRVKSSAFRPQSNALCERRNSQIWQALRCVCKEQVEWDEHLQSVMYSFRAQPCSTTSLSPFEIVFGAKMQMPQEHQFKPEATPKGDAAAYVKKMAPRLKIIRELAESNTVAAQAAYKAQYDKKERPEKFVVGMRVLLHQPQNVKRGESKKLTQMWVGPLRVAEVLSDTNVILMDCKTLKVHKTPVHVNRLRLYADDRDYFHNWSSQDQRAGSDQPNPDSSETGLDSSTNDRDNEATLDPDSESNRDNVEMRASFTGKSKNKVVKNNTAQDAEDIKDTQGTQQSRHDDKPMTKWVTAERLLKVRKAGKYREYLVKFEDKAIKPSWQKAEFVPQILKDEFHIKQTLTGRARKNKQKNRNT